jgi:hypothetical protein
MKSLYVDESGTHTLEPDKLDPTFPFFILTGIIFEEKAYQKFQKALQKLKKDIFGTEKIILHSLELTRTAKARQTELKILAKPDIRKQFYQGLNAIIKYFDFSIIAFVIDKKWYGKQFRENPVDPYFLCFNFLFDRYEEELRKNEEGRIYAEQRNQRLDKQFLLAWESAKIINEERLQKLQNHNIKAPKILKKSLDNNGLELADLISFRLSRIVQNKANKPEGNEIDLTLLINKIVAIGSLPTDLPLKPLKP